MARPKRAMRVTTVRFGTDLWNLLEREAELAGVSVSQYIREAALARASAAVATRDEDPFRALAAAPRGPTTAPAFTTQGPGRTEDERARVRRVAADGRSSAQAVRAESAQAQRKASTVRADSAWIGPTSR